jgi:hypothetical protein
MVGSVVVIATALRLLTVSETSHNGSGFTVFPTSVLNLVTLLDVAENRTTLEVVDGELVLMFLLLPVTTIGKQH